MNQSLRRISLMTKNGGQKSRDTIPSSNNIIVIFLLKYVTHNNEIKSLE
jgi:hypothetical protein